MGSNLFFKKKKYYLSKLFPKKSFKNDFIINDVKPLIFAKNKDITFYDSINYKDDAYKTKAGVCITTEKLQIDLPNKFLSGLKNSKEILRHLNEISIIDFDHTDVVRHPLVSKIVKAYSDQNIKK